jgi:predicted DNA-binding transcriptional regulator YafY
MPEHHHPSHHRMPRLTGPEATALLLAVHRVRDRLDGDAASVRHLTQALASAAGVPAQAAAWKAGMPLPDDDVMRAVRTGIAERRVLYIHHIRQDGDVRRVHIEPYHVRLEAGFWHLIGRLADDHTECVMRLDKVVSAAAEDVFEARPVDLDRYLGGVFVPGDPAATAVVRFGPHTAVYAQERWGAGRPLKDGGAELDIPYEGEQSLVRSLAEFGADFEVLAPSGLRAAVRTRAEAALANYGAGAST